MSAPIAKVAEVVHQVDENQGYCGEIQNLFLDLQAHLLQLSLSRIDVLTTSRVKVDVYQAVDPFIDIQEHSAGQEDHRQVRVNRQLTLLSLRKTRCIRMTVDPDQVP